MNWLPKNSVVVPIDFSDQSLDAVDTALHLVADASHLHVVHVLPIITDYEPGLMWSNINDEARIHHAELAMQERLPADKYGSIHLHVRLGDAGHEIADLAETISAELVVLPSHGRTGVRRLLIGSVAERVVRLCHCPVLVLKHP